jgi:hypothetical protein
MAIERHIHFSQSPATLEPSHNYLRNRSHRWKWIKTVNNPQLCLFPLVYECLCVDLGQAAMYVYLMVHMQGPLGAWFRVDAAIVRTIGAMGMDL